MQTFEYCSHFRKAFCFQQLLQLVSTKFFHGFLNFVLEYMQEGIEPTHGSVCSDVRKLQSMDVLKLQSTKADWNTKYPCHILAYIYSNLLDI